MSNIDENTRANARAGYDQITSFLAHFTDPDATWQSFGKTDSYLEFLSLQLSQLGSCVAAQLVARGAVEPTDYGT